MRAGRFPIWQKVAALAPLLLLSVSLPSQILLRCRIDGLLRSACCCPPEADTESSVPVVKAQDCCDREVIVNERTVAEPARGSGVGTAWATSTAIALPLVTLTLAAPVRSERAWQAHGPPRGGPSIVLLKHAFLI